MEIVVHDLNKETETRFKGTEEQVREELLQHYPWLAGHHNDSVYNMCEHLESTQMFDAEIVEHDFSLNKAEYGARDRHVVQAYLGTHDGKEAALTAARFLAGPDRVLDKKLHRDALYEHDGDHKKAALAGYGLEINEKNLKAL